MIIRFYTASIDDSPIAIGPYLSAAVEQVKMDFKTSFNWFVVRKLLLSAVSGRWTMISNLLPEKLINGDFPPGHKKRTTLFFLQVWQFMSFLFQVPKLSLGEIPKINWLFAKN